MKNRELKTLLITAIVLLLAVGCTKKSTEKQILSFKFISPDVEAIIDEESKTITATVPFNTDLTSMTPIIELSEKAAITPLSGIAVDFTNPVPYTVTAEDGSQVEYLATVTRVSVLGTWGVEKLEYWLTDYNGNMIPVTFQTYEFIPGDLDNGIDLTFRADMTGEMCDYSHPDTTIVKTHTYSLNHLNNQINIHRTGESFVLEVLELTPETFIIICEYETDSFEKAYLKRLAEAPNKHSGTKSQQRPKKAGSLLSGK